MSERQTGTGEQEEALNVQRGSGEVAAEPAKTGAFSMIRISPKWQMVLIGGVFIAINIMVMVIFLVAIFLRR
ncbi:MAG: hypothetical protein QM753_06270 [Thermomicrobiales bacterium]